MTIDLSAFYFDIRKDRLYCDPASSQGAAGGADGDRPAVRLPGALARADAALHLRGGVDGAARRCGARCIWSSSPMFRRPGATRRWKRSGRRSAGCAASSLGALEEVRAARRSDRLVARGGRCSSSPIRSLSRRSKVSTWRRSPSPPGFELRPMARAGECLPAPRRAGRRGRARSRRRGANAPAPGRSSGGRHRSGLPRRDASRRRGDARIRRSAAGRRIAWLAARRSLGSSPRSLGVLLDQAHKAWMLGPFDIEAKGRVALTPFLDLVWSGTRGSATGCSRRTVDLGRWLLIALRHCRRGALRLVAVGHAEPAHRRSRSGLSSAARSPT